MLGGKKNFRTHMPGHTAHIENRLSVTESYLTNFGQSCALCFINTFLTSSFTQKPDKKNKTLSLFLPSIHTNLSFFTLKNEAV